MGIKIYSGCANLHLCFFCFTSVGLSLEPSIISMRPCSLNRMKRLNLQMWVSAIELYWLKLPSLCEGLFFIFICNGPASWGHNLLNIIKNISTFVSLYSLHLLSLRVLAGIIEIMRLQNFLIRLKVTRSTYSEYETNIGVKRWGEEKTFY
jgi:hypothetical protein